MACILRFQLPVEDIILVAKSGELCCGVYQGSLLRDMIYSLAKGQGTHIPRLPLPVGLGGRRCCHAVEACIDCPCTAAQAL